MKLDEVTGPVVDTALPVHRALGPGLLESVYELVLARALRLADLRVGLLVNFGETRLKDGLHRIVNRALPAAPPRLRVIRSSELA